MDSKIIKEYKIFAKTGNGKNIPNLDRETTSWGIYRDRDNFKGGT